MKKFAIIFLGLMILSCQDIKNCGTNDNRNIMIIRFYDFESKKTKKAKKVDFTITAENSTFRFTPFMDSTGVGLPLNRDQKKTTFFFKSDKLSDFELEMNYDEFQIFIFDPKCDPSYIFLGLDTVRQNFDSTAVVGKVTNRQLNTNVEVYF